MGIKASLLSGEAETGKTRVPGEKAAGVTQNATVLWREAAGSVCTGRCEAEFVYAAAFHSTSFFSGNF